MGDGRGCRSKLECSCCCPLFFLEVTCALAWCLDAIANALGVTPLQELGLGTAPQLLSTSASLYHSGSQSGV